MIQDSHQIHLLITHDAKLMIYNTIWGSHLLQTLNNHPHSHEFLIETVSTSSEQSLLSLLNIESIASFPTQAVTSKQAKTALINGQKHIFKKIGNQFSRLKEVNIKSVVGIGINGRFDSERIECFLQIRRYDKKSKYYFLMLEHNCQQKINFKSHCDKMFSEMMLQAILSQITFETPISHNFSQTSIHVQHFTENINLSQNESILLPSMFMHPPLKDVCIFSGSFNPFHDGHYQMYNLSLTHPYNQNTPVIFEITTKNAEKEQNNEVEERIKSIVSYFNSQSTTQNKNKSQQQSFEDILHQLQSLGIQILISNKGRFIQKQLTRGCFIIGGDTYIRLFDLKYYNNDPKQLKKTIAKFIVDEVKLLVFNRKSPITDQFQQIENHGVQFEVFEGWSNDISSTKIRKLNKV